MALPAVGVGAVFLVLQRVQVGLGAVAVVQQGGVQLQDGRVRLVRVRAVRREQVGRVAVLVPSPLAVPLVRGSRLEAGLVGVDGVDLGTSAPTCPAAPLPQLIDGLESASRAHGVRIFVRRRPTGTLGDVGVRRRRLLGQVALALHRRRSRSGRWGGTWTQARRHDARLRLQRLHTFLPESSRFGGVAGQPGQAALPVVVCDGQVGLVGAGLETGTFLLHREGRGVVQEVFVSSRQ